MLGGAGEEPVNAGDFGGADLWVGCEQRVGECQGKQVGVGQFVGDQSVDLWWEVEKGWRWLLVGWVPVGGNCATSSHGPN